MKKAPKDKDMQLRKPHIAGYRLVVAAKGMLLCHLAPAALDSEDRVVVDYLQVDGLERGPSAAYANRHYEGAAGLGREAENKVASVNEGRCH